MFSHISVEQLSEIIKPIHLISSVNCTKIFIQGISTDTRTLRPKEVFIALKGNNFDGHDFIEMALAKGAIALVVDSDSYVNSSSKIPILVVKNTLIAYQQVAHWWRNQFHIPLIAITGSVGKTTTKELTAAILATQGEVLKTQSNHNNEIGVPLTLLRLKPSHNYAVIEMAMRARGEIALLTEIARPTIGLITNVGTAHIGRLGSVEAIAEAKCELLANMPRDGVAILNHDNSRLIETAEKFWSGRTVTFGLQGGDVWGKLKDKQTIIVDHQEFPLPLPGDHNALNYLGAIAVAKVLGINLSSLQSNLDFSIPTGRAKTYHLDSDILLLDETYNAGLESMKAALELLKATEGQRHLAILGEMKELGDYSPSFHFQVGEKVKQLEIEYLLLLQGEGLIEELARGAEGVTTEIFTDHTQLSQRLLELIQPGDRLLFKASRSVQLDLVVKQLLQYH